MTEAERFARYAERKPEFILAKDRGTLHAMLEDVRRAKATMRSNVNILIRCAAGEPPKCTCAACAAWVAVDAAEDVLTRLISERAAIRGIKNR